MFGGYDGQQRCNDLYAFNFRTNTWTLVESPVITPSRRDRHVAVVHDNNFYVFGGFDGRARVNGVVLFLASSRQHIVYSYPSSLIRHFTVFD